ncbi:phosphoribosylanthranilate isomerase [Flavobacterium sp. H122]|uniref:phosphoribosylanthranilate isomerase n=1 Tax=Flavobacterium sp. H122 TaxID=2529860 RepID=UPI00145A1EB7|nr:phosphoribosylanthranilate isomerase [Flavobacterium sp. H122]
MKYPENIQEAAQLQPDYLGLIFYEKSPRYFNGIVPEISKSIQKVGVFVNAPLNEILEKIKLYDLQVIQLHGNESPDFCDLLKHINVEIIKAFQVDDTFDFETIQQYENVCDYFLFDTKGKHFGGNGTTFNWQLLENYPSQKPYFLSGGIGIGEVSQFKDFQTTVIGKLCIAIDVNSKFEIQPGLKNTQQLKEFKNELSR